MGFNSTIYKAAADLMYERRLNAEKSADRRREEIYAKLPRTKELEQQIADTGIRAVRTVIGGGNAAEQMKMLKEVNLSLQKELVELLTSNGYPADVFEPKYLCKSCNDTGYYESDGKTLMCPCMKKALVQCAVAELNKTAPLSLSTFGTFDLNYYSKEFDKSIGVVPYNHMEKVKKYCMGYADNFHPKANSILMYGNTGLGKTHLSLAIANEVIQKGFGVIYVSAPSLAQQLEKEHFSRDNSNSVSNMLLDCDLLIIDDLGTEFQTKFSTSELYNIFNSRLLLSKPVIINTNYDFDKLEEIYSDRFVSRIIGNAQKLAFLGTDIRIRKK